jgi:signal transduction histidine kinase/ActR/RegA family two-component response regulator
VESSVRERAAELFCEQRKLLIQKVDRSFAVLMLCQYGACVLGATVFALVGAHPSLNVWTAILLGALFTGPAVILVRLRPGETETRHTIAAGQMLMSSLLIHLTGGRIETHFHIFGSLAFLAFYRDARVLITASAIVAADHFVRGLFWPESVFGLAAPDHWRWLEHTGWVIFEDAFLILSIRQNQETLWNLMVGRAELEKERDRAEQASRAKDDFMAVLSHELRTPLTPSLMALSSLTEDEQLRPETRSELELVRRNVELEARLIDDLLDLTRITRGKLQLTPGNVDLHLLLRQLLESSRAEFAEKQLVVEERLGAKNSWVYGDNARLQQVFWNLVKNAVKFTPAGGRIVLQTEDAGDRIKVDLTDTGVGIDAEVLPKIFERFEQGGVAVTRQFGGLGLGLSICRAIVEMHRGAIRAESRGPTWGSTFTVVMPAHGASNSPAKANTQTQRLRLSGILPRRVLLVDDHVDTRETIKRLLTKAGYEVTTAGSVQAALQRAQDGRFDLLLSDIGLPDGSGCDLMVSLKADYKMPGVAFSGFGMEDDVRKSLEAGFAAHLTKPVDFQRLKEVMGQAISGKNPPQARAA